MTYTSIFEKILLIFKTISTSWIYIAFIAVAIILIALLALKKISKKTSFLTTILATILVLSYTIYNYYEPISKMMNTLIDNMFINIYFPSAYAYLFILILINVIAVASLLNPRGEKIYKNVNGLCLIITDFILALILEIIAKDNIDIFAKKSLFANTTLVTLLEFSVNIFIVWLISLVAIYIINIITERIIITRENKKLVQDPAITIDQELSVNMATIKDDYQATTNATEPAIVNPVQAIMPTTTENKFIPNFTITTPVVEPVMDVQPQNTFIPVINNEPTTNYSYNYTNNSSFDLSAFIPKKQEVKPITIMNNPTNNNTNQIFEQILNNELPLIKEEETPVSVVEETKNTYTLNDYRIFNKMLKDIREHNQSNSITIDKNLEYRLITKYSTETYNMFKTMLKIYSN